MNRTTTLREWGLERGLVQTLFAPAAQDLISRVDVDGLRVLDAGCGSGIVARLAVLAGAREVVGVDYCDEALRVAEVVGSSPRLRFESRNLMNDELTDLGTFDLIFAAHLVEQIGIGAVATLAKTLNPGGQIVISAWWLGGLEHCPAYDLIYTATGLRDSNSPTFAISPGDLTKIASAAELEVEINEISTQHTRPVERIEELVEEFLAGSSFGLARSTVERERYVSAARGLDVPSTWRGGDGRVTFRQSVLVARA